MLFSFLNTLSRLSVINNCFNFPHTHKKHKHTHHTHFAISYDIALAPRASLSAPFVMFLRQPTATATDTATVTHTVTATVTHTVTATVTDTATVTTASATDATPVLPPRDGSLWHPRGAGEIPA